MNFDVSSFTNRRVHRFNRLCVGDLLERMTWSLPNKVAIVALEGAYSVEENRVLTYKQANDKANQFASGLFEAGLKKEDRVIFFCGNSTEYVIMQIAIAKSGMIIVPLNVMVSPEVMEYIIQETQPKFAVVDADVYPAARAVFEKYNLSPNVTVPIGGEVVAGSQSFEDFIKGKSIVEPVVDIQPTDVFQIMYTSGTTSKAKGVMHSHLNMYFSMIPFSMSMGRGVPTELDVKGGIFYPIFHIAAQEMNFSNYVCGGTTVLVRKPDVRMIAEAVTKEKITFTFGSPALYYELADLVEQNMDKYDLTSIKAIGYGWSSFRPDYDEKLRKLTSEDTLIIGLDGQTECVTDTRYWHHMWYETFQKTEPVLNHFGVSHPLYATTIMDEKGNHPCQTGEIGEKVMRGPAVMEGYYKNQEATFQAFKDGWFRGGDVGCIDEEGVITFTDRIKDVIKSGGENVASRRVEDVLLLHAKVKDVAVIGLPHEKWGEAVTAVVIPNDESYIENELQQELIEYCKTILTRYEVPKWVIITDYIPATVGGKRQKHKLREKFANFYQEF